MCVSVCVCLGIVVVVVFQLMTREQPWKTRDAEKVVYGKFQLCRG